MKFSANTMIDFCFIFRKKNIYKLTLNDLVNFGFFIVLEMKRYICKRKLNYPLVLLLNQQENQIIHISFILFFRQVTIIKLKYFFFENKKKVLTVIILVFEL